MTNLGGKIKATLSKRKWSLKVKTWALVVLLIPLSFADATLLRIGHIKMTELRDAVLAADAKISENEDASASKVSDEELKQALVNLKEFVFGNIVINITEENGIQNISFGTGPFYLEHQYLRDAHRALEEAEKQLSSDDNPNGNVYGQASEVCQPQAIANGWVWDSPEYINCMLSEIQKYPAAGDIQDTIIAALPSTELYRHNYASPIWAPTLAGWLLLITLIIIVVIFIRILIWIVLRLSLLFI
ncbi:hypothetical protein IJG29_02675 [Candidatus Saccharibacteria bacterium]|nr:hypothetical protein [Candidatus Saccharibacteria bacterium]